MATGSDEDLSTRGASVEELHKIRLTSADIEVAAGAEGVKQVENQLRATNSAGSRYRREG